jgi:hypothetical protein
MPRHTSRLSAAQTRSQSVRRQRPSLQGNLIETLLMRCGRPVVIATESPCKSAIGTIVVGWKECAEAARAVSAAMPLLERAQKVVLAGVEEADAGAVASLEAPKRQLTWHGIASDTCWITRSTQSGALARGDIWRGYTGSGDACRAPRADVALRKFVRRGGSMCEPVGTHINEPRVMLCPRKKGTPAFGASDQRGDLRCGLRHHWHARLGLSAFWPQYLLQVVPD